MLEDRAALTQPYTVYLAARADYVTLSAGTEFMLYAQVREDFMGVYKHPKYGEITIVTPHAVRITPLAPGMFIVHSR
jgi:hypothetical protein